jgi:SAM-dependent methyltransferase
MDWVEQVFDDEFFARDFLLVKEDKERTASDVRFVLSELALKSSDRVLDLACGFGRLTLPIAPHVKEVIGVDRTSSYIDDARATAEDQGIGNAIFGVLDMRQLTYEEEFDAVINYFTAWGYYDEETNFDVLRRVRRALRPGGRFLLEFIHRDGEVRRLRPRSWVRRSDGVLVLYDRRVDSATGRYHIHTTFVADGGIREVEIDHQLPTSDEFVKLFRQAGFGQVRLVSAPDGGELTLESRRLAVIGTAGR